MAEMNANSSLYRREIRMFRGEMTNVGPPGGPRTLKGAGYQWYKVKAEPGLSLYFDTANLYMKAFKNPTGCYKFHSLPDPTAPRGGAIINATELDFLESYNGNGPRSGIGLPQDTPATITLQNLDFALAMLVADNFTGKAVDAQRLACARCVVAIVEAARFKDVEDHIVNGSQITDRSWVNHVNQASVMITPP
jgi:hypothetical protein